MATVGQVLSAPESGWERYDNTDPNITYVGSGWVDWVQDPSFYNNTLKQTSNANDSAKFNFTGCKIRLIGSTYCNKSDLINVYIDNKLVGTINQYISSGSTDRVLTFSIENLFNTEHFIVFQNTENKYFSIDAIDIDSNGILKPYNPNLKKNNF
jgi:hypothetical protein